MKILLIGEFSGLHNNLKSGLIELGHDVTLASTGDGWKKFPSDISWLPTKFKGRAGYMEYLYRQMALSRKLKDFDVVQFISNYLIFDKRFGLDQTCYNNFIKNNHKTFFISAGADPNIWQFWMSRQDGIVSNLIQKTNKTDLHPKLVRNLLHSNERLKTLSLVERSNGLIPVMYEYAEPYRELHNLCPTIPIPINTTQIPYSENKLRSKLVVFHGLNRRGAKGTEYVEKAFETLRKRYPNDLELIISGNMKYSEYLEFIKRVNVIIDQTNSYSLGINGLISLAQGKVTLGGAEAQGKTELGYDECPVINVNPDPKDITNKIEYLLDIRKETPEIGEKSRLFVEKYHDHINIAKMYLKVWKTN